MAAKSLHVAQVFVPVRIIQNGEVLSSKSKAKDIPYGNIGAIHNMNKVEPLLEKEWTNNATTSTLSVMYPEILMNMTINIVKTEM